MTDLTPETVNKTLAKFLWDTGGPVHMAFTRSLDMCRMVEQKLHEKYPEVHSNFCSRHVRNLVRAAEDLWICDPATVASSLAQTIIEAELVEVE